MDSRLMIVAKEPSADDKIYKDECAYCFDTPNHPGGLYICLSKYVGLCGKHLMEYAERTGSKCYLNIKRRRLEDNEVKAPGFSVSIKPQDMDSYSVHLAPNLYDAIPLPLIHTELYRICDAVIMRPSASVQDQLDNGASDWGTEEVVESQLSESLVQVNPNKTIPYEGWECEQPGCRQDENLWMNLSDGTIFCGRTSNSGPNLLFDMATLQWSWGNGNPAGGSGHSEQHARETGFHLVVKLGTIEPSGKADLYQYVFGANGEEIGYSVKDSRLQQHLAHFGLDMTRFKKR